MQPSGSIGSEESIIDDLEESDKSSSDTLMDESEEFEERIFSTERPRPAFAMRQSTIEEEDDIYESEWSQADRLITGAIESENDEDEDIAE